MASNRPVAIFPSRIWGPRPRFALVPLAGAAAVVALLLARPDGPPAAPAPVVTAFKPPADGGPVPAAAAQGIPIEVVHGVPSPATLHLWIPQRGATAAMDDAG